MFCNFDLCEFYNVVLGGLLIGVITSFVFIGLTKRIKQYNFRAQYNYLNSLNNAFDWTAYSMKKEDGRIREDSPNGSTVNIKIVKDKIYIQLKNGDRKWKGELIMYHNDFGIISYKYTDGHEYGKRECVIGEFEECNKKFDYIFLTPLDNKLYYLAEAERKLMPVYQYGNEIFIRERICP